MVAEPEAIALESGRRIDQLDALVLDACLQPREVLRIAAERQVMQRLGLDAFDNGAPAVIVTESLDGEHIAVAADIETEVAVEILRDSRIGNGEDKLVERMHTERIGFSGRRDIAADSGHHLLH